MKIYQILTKSNSKDVFFIEESLSIFAFIFQSLWLIYHKLWFQAILVLIVQYIIFKVVDNNYINTDLGLIFEFMIAIILAIFAKTWYIKKMKNNNYQLSVIVAKNLDDAKLHFYQLTMDQKDVRQE